MKWFGRSKQPEFCKVSLENPSLQAIYQHCTTLNPRKIIKQTIEETRFVVIDTETTGFQAYSQDEIVSIALLELNGMENTGREFKTLINPERSIPESSTKIHGLRDEDVADAPSLSNALPEIMAFISNGVLVGHHVNFDIRFLNKRLQKLAGCSLQNPWVDTMLLYLELTGKMGHYCLEDVAKAAGVEISERHTAYGDATTALNIFVVLTQQIVKSTEPVSRLIAMQYDTEF
ncbi:3'-5' exonuclease [Kaarinaea lacus]